MVRIATASPIGHFWPRVSSRSPRLEPPLARISGSRRRDYASRLLARIRSTDRRQLALEKTSRARTCMGAAVSPAAATAEVDSADGLGPGGLDPVRRGGRFVVARARLRPAERSGDVPDGNGDDAVGIPARELVLWKVLAEPGDRVLVGLVVGPHVEVARRGIHAEPLELADDRLVLGPPAGQLVGPLDGGLQQVERHIRPFRLEVRVFFPALVVALDEALVERPAVAAGIGEVIVGVHAGEHALGVVLADRMGRHAEGDGARDLHFVEQAVAERLLVEGDVIATRVAITSPSTSRRSATAC